MKLTVFIYCRVVELRSELKQIARNTFSKITKAAPARMRTLLVDANGDLTTTLAWVFGIAVIAGVGAAVYTQIIAPNLSTSVTKSSNLVNSIP